jgi:hypothetical protein
MCLPAAGWAVQVKLMRSWALVCDVYFLEPQVGAARPPALHCPAAAGAVLPGGCSPALLPARHAFVGFLPLLLSGAMATTAFLHVDIPACAPLPTCWTRLQTRRPDESAQEFAERVQRMIAGEPRCCCCVTVAWLRLRMCADLALHSVYLPDVLRFVSEWPS